MFYTDRQTATCFQKYMALLLKLKQENMFLFIVQQFSGHNQKLKLEHFSLRNKVLFGFLNKQQPLLSRLSVRSCVFLWDRSLCHSLLICFCFFYGSQWIIPSKNANPIGCKKSCQLFQILKKKNT